MSSFLSLNGLKVVVVRWLTCLDLTMCSSSLRLFKAASRDKLQVNIPPPPIHEEIRPTLSNMLKLVGMWCLSIIFF